MILLITISRTLLLKEAEIEIVCNDTHAGTHFKSGIISHLMGPLCMHTRNTLTDFSRTNVFKAPLHL